MLTGFPIPSLDTHAKLLIAQLTDQESASTNELLSDAYAALSLAHERRAALISAAVTGQIDVTGRRAGPSEAERLDDELARSR